MSVHPPKPAPEPVALFERHCTLMATSDVDALLRLYAPDVFYYDPLAGKLLGAEQVARYLASLGQYFEELPTVVTNAWTFNNRAAIEWVQTLTRDGQQTIQRGSCFLTERDGMIAAHVDYFSLGRTEAILEVRRHLALPT